VQSLVKLHGGEVVARSEGQGKGSEFVVTLPRAPEEVAEPASPVAPHPPRNGAARRVLLVDDNADARDLIADALQYFGHGVQAVADGAQALAVAASQEFDVALLDIGLPVMDGYELAQHLRRLRGNSLRIFALTGYGLEQDRARAKGAGFDGHFVKPVELDVLDAAIRGAASG
jgi:CheY-like chemotaxis protein